MALQNTGAVKYAELTDEHIVDVKQGIELFVQSEEYWDKFAHHSSVPRGHKTFQSRRLIRPKVKYEDISPRAELVAPRPTKIAVATFSKTVTNYGDKAIYTREDLQYHFDDTLGNIRYTLQEIAVQKLNLIKAAFIVLDIIAFVLAYIYIFKSENNNFSLTFSYGCVVFGMITASEYFSKTKVGLALFVIAALAVAVIPFIV